MSLIGLGGVVITWGYSPATPVDIQQHLRAFLVSSEGQTLIGGDIEHIHPHQLGPRLLSQVMTKQSSKGQGELPEGRKVDGVTREGLLNPLLLLSLPVQTCTTPTPLSISYWNALPYP